MGQMARARTRGLAQPARQAPRGAAPRWWTSPSPGSICSSWSEAWKQGSVARSSDMGMLYFSSNRRTEFRVLARFSTKQSGVRSRSRSASSSGLSFSRPPLVAHDRPHDVRCVSVAGSGLLGRQLKWDLRLDPRFSLTDIPLSHRFTRHVN